MARQPSPSDGGVSSPSVWLGESLKEGGRRGKKKKREKKIGKNKIILKNCLLVPTRDHVNISQSNLAEWIELVQL